MRRETEEEKEMKARGDVRTRSSFLQQQCDCDFSGWAYRRDCDTDIAGNQREADWWSVPRGVTPRLLEEPGPLDGAGRGSTRTRQTRPLHEGTRGRSGASRLLSTGPLFMTTLLRRRASFVLRFVLRRCSSSRDV